MNPLSRFLKFALLVTAFTCTSSVLHAQSLAWDANTETDLAGYRVYLGTQSGTYTTQVDVGKTTTYAPQGVDWTHRAYFAVKAYNTSGLESSYSNEAVWTPPSITKVTSLTASTPYPLVVGTPVSWTAIASNNLGPVEYRFVMCRKSTWSIVQDYGASNVFTWTPQASDVGSPNYVQVWVRAVGSTASYEAYLGTAAFDIQPAPLTLTANVDFPTPPGNQVTWTATLGNPPTSPVEYMFRVLDVATSTWSTLSNYSSSNQVQWTPSAAGQYVIQGWSRQVGSPAQFDVAGSSPTLTVAATPLTVTSFTTPTVFPASTGTPIKFTARVKGGMAGPIQYSFWMYSATKGWRNAQWWGPTETFTWTPTWDDEDDYAVQVWVRSNGSTATYEAWLGTQIFHIQRAAMTLTTSTLFPVAVGTPVVWATDVPDPTVNMEYQFWIYQASVGWYLGQDYGPQKTFTWTPTAVDTYGIQSWGRRVGSTEFYEVYRSSGLKNVVSAPPQMVSLTSSTALPAAAGTTITWTAGATGGTAPLEYQFWRQDGASWVMVQDYSPSNTYTWATTAGDVGQHAVQARTRSTGSSAAYEAQMTTGVFSIQ